MYLCVDRRRLSASLSLSLSQMHALCPSLLLSASNTPPRSPQLDPPTVTPQELADDVLLRNAALPFSSAAALVDACKQGLAADLAADPVCCAHAPVAVVNT